MKFRIHTLGCKVNLYESEAIASQLLNEGFLKATDFENADVEIINTCTVTSTSDSKSRKLIRSIAKTNSNAVIVVMGCYSQLNPKSIESIDGVDIILGTNNRHKIPELIKEYVLLKTPINIVKSSDEYKTFEELELHSLTKHTRGFIKIQDGCENFCSYCAIPYARGPIKSRDAESITLEIKNLVSLGVKEIVLAGINTGTYGKDLKGISLASLLRKIIVEVPDLYRVRLSSIELMEVTDELLDVLAEYPDKIARHLHIPLQAGADATLKRMHRKYDTKTYAKRIAEIRERLGDIAITTDCLAGFVGESEIDFECAMTFIQKMQFMTMHIFPYSRRKNTEADKMEGHLDPQLINKRAHLMQKLSQSMHKDYIVRYLGKEMDVLFEQRKQNLWVGHTTNYLEVAIEASESDLTNEVRKVKLLSYSDGIIHGEEV